MTTSNLEPIITCENCKIKQRQDAAYLRLHWELHKGKHYCGMCKHNIK